MSILRYAVINREVIRQRKGRKHLIELIKMVRAFNPVVFYLSAKDIGERLAKVSNSRGKNAPTNEDVVFWQNRNDTDLRVLRRLPVESHILDITSNNWDAAMDTIISVMENDPVLRHYDALIDENSDPVRDPAILKEYMDKWDGAAFIEALQLSPEKSVLEIGAGTGRLAVRVCDKCRSFTGIDISPKTVDRAKENLQDFANADLICGDFFNYSSDKTFDVIYSSLTFMHIYNKRAAIEKVANLLIPGGRFVLSISKNQQTIIDYRTRQVAVYPDTPEEIALLLNKAGLTIEKQFKTEFAVIFAARKGV